MVGYAAGSGDVRRGNWSRTDGSTESARLALTLRDRIEGKRGGDNYSSTAELEAAQASDSFAEHAADKEREYQAVWSTGSRYRDILDSMAAEKESAKALRAELKAARALAKSSGVKLPAVCKALLIVENRAHVCEVCPD